MFRSRSIAPLMWACVIAASSNYEVSAFKTFRAVGGNVHEQIIREALAGKVSEQNIRTIDWACTRNDNPRSDRFHDARHHFDSNKIDQSLSYIDGRMQTAVAAAERADTDPGRRDEVLQAMGDLLHSIQDFYSHSNYVEIMLMSGVAPDKIEPIDWSNRPANLKTCYFHMDSLIDNEATRSRDVCIRKLNKQYFGANFASSSEKSQLLGRGDYEGAINFATSHFDLLHCELNKDNGNETQGKVCYPNSAWSLHSIARKVAVKETLRQWNTLTDRIRAEYPDRAQNIISAISGQQVTTATVPKIAGHWIANFGAHYQLWQNGKEYGWKFPHEEGRGVIADDGKSAQCKWWGQNCGTDTATLQYENGVVVRIVGSNGVTLSRAPDNK